MTFEMVATTLFGLEEILAKELKALGANDIQIVNRAVKFSGDQSLLYKSNLHLRTALKVLKPIAFFHARNDIQLYKKVKELPWDEFFTFKQSFAIDAVCNGEVFRHSKYAALKAKDAIADKFREESGIRPSVDTIKPDVQINVHIADTKCTISLDSSGLPLSKRGYRLDTARAPINEVLAAGLLHLSGWDKKRLLLDPMCGSGTIPIEAAMIAGNYAPGRLRNFGFEKWSDFDESLWKKIKEEAEAQIIAPEGKIQGRDFDSQALDSAMRNARRAGLGKIISLKSEDFFETESRDPESLIMINPPYGERMEEKDKVNSLYDRMGTHLKHKFEGSDAWIISSNLEALKFIGLRTSRKIKVFNGSLECRFNKYELYRGSKKGKHGDEGTKGPGIQGP